MGKKQASGLGQKIIASHRRARHDYAIDDTFEAGLVLQGTEVKSLRQGHANIAEAHITVENGEAFLLNAYIPEYSHGNINNHSTRRKRKLLLHGREIHRIFVRISQKGFTAVPMTLYFKQGRVKLEFGLGKGKKHYDKRQDQKEKSARRDMRNAY